MDLNDVYVRMAMHIVQMLLFTKGILKILVLIKKLGLAHGHQGHVLVYFPVGIKHGSYIEVDDLTVTGNR